LHLHIIKKAGKNFVLPGFLKLLIAASSVAILSLTFSTYAFPISMAVHAELFPIFR
jgi:hypothetical protein